MSFLSYGQPVSVCLRSVPFSQDNEWKLEESGIFHHAIFFDHFFLFSNDLELSFGLDFSQRALQFVVLGVRKGL